MEGQYGKHAGRRVVEKRWADGRVGGRTDGRSAAGGRRPAAGGWAGVRENGWSDGKMDRRVVGEQAGGSERERGVERKDEHAGGRA